jgi:hypothetical protein
MKGRTSMDESWNGQIKDMRVIRGYALSSADIAKLSQCLSVEDEDKYLESIGIELVKQESDIRWYEKVSGDG